MSSRTDEILEVQAFFWKQLCAAGWKDISKIGSSATFQDGRRVITVGNQGDDSLYWNAFPSVTSLGKQDPLVGYVGPDPIPVGTFEITGSAAHCEARANIVDKNGNLTQESFFEGTMAAVYKRLFDESITRIEGFIAAGETVN